MDLRVSRQGEVAVVAAEGELKLGHGDTALNRTFETLFGQGVSRFVLDLRDVTVLDSASLGEILACHKKALDLNGRIHLVLTPDGRIHEFFKTAHLHRVFKLYTDEASAVAGFGSS